MSKTVLVNYADEQMTRSQVLCSSSAMSNGVSTVWPQTPDTISNEFRQANKDIFQSGIRGADCYWLFKPYVVYNAINQMEYGDILVYADAGVEFVAPVSHIIDRMDQNVFLFTNTHPNHHWTKRYTLDIMMPDWNDRYGVNDPWPQVQASVIFFQVCDQTKALVKKWLMWCQMPGIINDDPMGLAPQLGFQDHRHDQSVLTLLTYQYKYHWWPTQYSEHIRVPGDTYPVMFNHHRKRNNEW